MASRAKLEANRRYEERNYLKVRAGQRDRYARRARENRLPFLVRDAKQRAKRKGVAFDLYDHWPELERRMIPKRCELTGIPFNFEGGQTWDSPSIDRIVPQRGYVISNVRFILHGLNVALGNWGEDKLRVIVSAWLGSNFGKGSSE